MRRLGTEALCVRGSFSISQMQRKGKSDVPLAQNSHAAMLEKAHRTGTIKRPAGFRVNLGETAMADTDKPDAIALLKADHRKVEGLFAQFEAAKGDAKRKALADQICLELSVHTKIEEDVFYPACEGAIEGSLLKEAYVEHDGAKVLIAEIEAGGPDGAYYDAKVKVLSEQIKHHVKEEEERVEGMFSRARKAGLDMDALGQRMAAEKLELTKAYKAGGLPKLKLTALESTTLA